MLFVSVKKGFELLLEYDLEDRLLCFLDFGRNKIDFVTWEMLSTYVFIYSKFSERMRGATTSPLVNDTYSYRAFASGSQEHRYDGSALGKWTRI